MDATRKLDTAIAPDLRVTRTNPAQRRSETYRPESDAFAVRLVRSVRQLTIAYFGAQSPERGNLAAAAAIGELNAAMTEVHGPIHRDRAIWVDDRGFTNRFLVAYWIEQTDFDDWFRARGAAWTADRHLVDGVGFFAEIVRPTVDRLETIFTSPSHPEGVANLAETMSEPIVESGYWGAMRDRLPITQTDPVTGSGVPTGSLCGARVVIVPQDNLTLIRSGQDYSETIGAERDFFLNEIEPTLRAGMDFLRDNGRAIGCFTNRYMDVVDEQERFAEKRFAMSLWNDLASLEEWAKSHPTHATIFAAAMRHLAKFGATANLRLYHEVAVVERGHQWFEYLNCHEGTGLLRAGSA